MNTLLPTLRHGAEPFYFKAVNGDSSVGCLCLHGFTASPDEMRWFGHALAQQGITTYGPRLVAHGADYRDMSRMKWHDWYLCALDGYHVLRQQCEQVFVAGLSMGGLLSLLLASAVPVSGAIVIAAPFFIDSRMFEASHMLKYVMPYTKQLDTSELMKHIQAEQVRRKMPVVGRVRYDDWSTAAASELHNVMMVACEIFCRIITCPARVMYSRGDKTVPPRNGDYLQANIGSKVVERHDFERSDHILTQDVDCDAVFALGRILLNGTRRR
ncbi:MAG: alpha/beta fold hydrolase [Anaerolineae bacterium]